MLDLLMKPYLRTRMAGWFIPQAQRRRIKDAFSARNLERPTLPAEAWEQLMPLYHDDILKLQDMLGRDLSGWLRDYSV